MGERKSWRDEYAPQDIVEPELVAPPGACLVEPHRHYPRIRVANITLDGKTLTVPRSQLLDTLDADSDEAVAEYTVTFSTIGLFDFHNMEEFDGF